MPYVHYVVIRRGRRRWQASCLCGARSGWRVSANGAGAWKRNHPIVQSFEPIGLSTPSEVAVPVYRGLAGGGNRDAGTSVTSPATPTDRPRVGALGGPSRLNRLTGEATR